YHRNPVPVTNRQYRSGNGDADHRDRVSRFPLHSGSPRRSSVHWLSTTERRYGSPFPAATWMLARLPPTSRQKTPPPESIDAVACQRVISHPLPPRWVIALWGSWRGCVRIQVTSRSAVGSSRFMPVPPDQLSPRARSTAHRRDPHGPLPAVAATRP